MELSSLELPESGQPWREYEEAIMFWLSLELGKQRSYIDEGLQIQHSTLLNNFRAKFLPEMGAETHAEGNVVPSWTPLERYQLVGAESEHKTQNANASITEVQPRHILDEPFHKTQPPDTQALKSDEATGNPHPGRWVNPIRVDPSARSLDPDARWTVRLRWYVTRMLNNPWFEILTACIVTANVITMWISADIRAAGAVEMDWVRVVDVAFLLVYIGEFCLRWFIAGGRVLDNHWYKLDFAVIVIDILLLLLRVSFDVQRDVNVKQFRLFRIFRLTRIMKVLNQFSEVQLLIHGLVGALRALTFAAIMLWLFIIMWSFLFVEFIDPLTKHMTEKGSFDSCPQCQVAYSSIFAAQLTLIQHAVAGDSWGTMSLPIVKEYPATFPMFAGALLSIQLGILNVICTVIVDAADQCRKNDEKILAEEKEREFEVFSDDVLEICQGLDEDESGTLSLSELVQGFHNHDDFNDKMTSVGITLEDLETLFRFLDDDNSGALSYMEFVNNLYKLQKHDLKTTLFFLKGHVAEIRNKLNNEIGLHMEEIKLALDRQGVKIEQLDIPPQLLGLRNGTKDDDRLLASRVSQKAQTQRHGSSQESASQHVVDSESRCEGLHVWKSTPKWWCKDT